MPKTNVARIGEEIVNFADGELGLHRRQRWMKTCSVSCEIEYNMTSYRVGERMLAANMVNTNVPPLLEQSLNRHLHNEPGCSVFLLQYWNPACFMCIKSVPVSGRALMETVSDWVTWLP